jgi:hypothetical protein
MRCVNLLFLTFLVFANKFCFSENNDTIRHRLAGYTMISVGGDNYPGQMLGVEYSVQKRFYGASLSYSQYYHNSRTYFFPYWPPDLYIPTSYSSKLISLTPFIHPIQRKWFVLSVNAGVTFSREDYLHSTVTTPVMQPTGDIWVEGNYLLKTDYVFGVTLGLGMDFNLSESVALFANSKVIVMQYPGIGQVLVGGGVRFSL